jgi:uncharacterized protein (UPF0264 family)
MENQNIARIQEVPNGDITRAVSDFNSVRKAVASRSADGVSIQDMAYFIAAAKVLADKIGHYVDLYSRTLKDAGKASYDFVDVGRTVSVSEGRSQSEISKKAFDELTLDEIKLAAVITEKGLKEAKRSDLIDKYKTATGKTAPVLSIKALK